jgi:hypothetical protein
MMVLSTEEGHVGKHLISFVIRLNMQDFGRTSEFVWLEYICEFSMQSSLDWHGCAAEATHVPQFSKSQYCNELQ